MAWEQGYYECFVSSYSSITYESYNKSVLMPETSADVGSVFFLGSDLCWVLLIISLNDTIL